MELEWADLRDWDLGRWNPIRSRIRGRVEHRRRGKETVENHDGGHIQKAITQGEAEETGGGRGHREK